MSRTLKSSIADQVVRVPLRGGRDAFVYVLIEHKREAWRFMLVQVLRYLSALYERNASEAKGRLPLVVPIVVFNGGKPFDGATRFRELVSAPADARRFAIDFEVVLLDVSKESARQLSAHRVLRGGLLALKAATVEPRQRRQIIRSAIDELRADRSTLESFVGYFSQVAGPEALPDVADALDASEEQMRTIADMWKSEGRREGRRAGRREGQREGLRRALERVLKRRFSRVPAELSAQLAAADSKTLERWLDAAVTGRTLRSVFQ